MMTKVGKVNVTKTIDRAIFSRLLSNAKRDSGEGVDLIGFRSVYGAYEIGFYAELSDDYRVAVDNFGYTGVSWVQLLPSSYQISLMQKMIDDEVSDIRQHTETFIYDPYDHFGVSITDFF